MVENPLNQLHPRAVTLFRVESLSRGAILAAAAFAAEWVFGTPAPFGVIGGTVAILAVGIGVLLPGLRYRAWGFVLRDSDLYLRYGVLFRTTSIVPHVRIQHVDTRHGPVDRWLGLAELVVYTAGTRGAIIAIPGLGREDAESLRDRLATLSGAGDAV